MNILLLNVRPIKLQKCRLILKRFEGKRNINSVFLDSVKESEVDKGITQLNANKPNGYDNITSKVVRNIPSYIVKPLTHIFNFVTGIIPDALTTTTSFICMTIQAHTVLQKLGLGIKITTQGNRPFALRGM